MTEEWNNRVQVFDKTGAYLTTIGGNWGSSTGDLRNPEGIALDSKGNLYVADEYNARIQKFAPAVPYWSQQNLDGFGKLDDNGVFALTSFNGSLYAGTSIANGQGAQIWRKASTGWQEVLPDGFEDGSNVAIDALYTYNGYLYATTANCTNNDCTTSNGGQLWRSHDGSTWQPVVTDGFGNSNNAEIFYLSKIGSNLCASTWNYASDGAQLWCSSSGDPGTWAQDGANGFGNSNNSAFMSAQVYNGAAFIGTFNSTDGAEIFRKDPSSGNWIGVAATGMGDKGNDAAASMAVYNKFLYVIFGHTAGGGSTIWRCQVCDGSDWINVVPNGFNNPNANHAPALVVLKTGIYAFLGNRADGLQVYQSKDGLIWKKVGVDGLGSSHNLITYWGNAVTVLNNTLYLGTYNPNNGGGVWKFCPTSSSCK